MPGQQPQQGPQFQGQQFQGPPPPGYGPPANYPPRPQAPSGSFAMVVIAALGAAGVAVFWAILGVVAVLVPNEEDTSPDRAAKAMADSGGSVDTLSLLDKLAEFAHFLPMLLLLGGAAMLLARKMPGVLLLITGAVFGAAPLVLTIVYKKYWEFTGVSADGAQVGALVLGLIVAVLAILPPVLRAVRTVAPQPQYGRPTPQQYPPQPGYGPPPPGR